MNFLSSAFSSLTGTSIPYTFQNKVLDPSLAAYPDARSVWTVYDGVNPKSGTLVLIFEFSLKDASYGSREGLARNSFRKLKVIKFPSVISALDFFESDSYLYVVTERVEPLARYLAAHDILDDAKFWGFHDVARAVLFINMKAGCLHGNIGMDSVYVNEQGEWKLFGFEILTNLTSDPQQPFYRNCDEAPGFGDILPLEFDLPDLVRQFPAKFDSFKLGAFLYVLLNCSDFSRPFKAEHTTLITAAGVPKALLVPYKRLVSVKANLRSTAEKFLSDLAAYFENNPLVAFTAHLDELKFQNEADTMSFFKHDMAHYMECQFPPGYLDKKLLPQIIAQFNVLSLRKPTVNTTPEAHQLQQETLSILLNYVLKLGVTLAEKDFSVLVKPVIFQAFTILDRSIRMSLLKYLPEYNKFLTELEVQYKIFSSLISGFQDTNFLIRETTLTSISAIIDKVSTKQVNQELLRVLAKLQMDPKPSIRTNTLVLIVKILGKIYTTSRNNVVITALAKALRDTFTPCKMTALSGFEQLIDEFLLEEICGKILGHLSLALMDPKSFKVRQEAKRVFQLYFLAVEKHAQSLPQDEDEDDAEESQFYDKARVLASDDAKPAQESSLSFGWMMSKLVNPAEINGQLNKGLDRSTPDLTRVSSPKIEQAPAPPADDEWDDSWQETTDIAEPVVAPKVKQTALGVKPATAASRTLRAASSGSLKLGKSKAKTPGSSLKLNLDLNEDDDEWGGEW